MTYAENGNTWNGAFSITIVEIPPVITGIRIEGSASVDENTTAQYTCVADYDDGSSVPVTPQWTVDCPELASVTPEGLLTVGEVAEDTACQLNVTYAENGNTWNVFHHDCGNPPGHYRYPHRGPGIGR